MPTPTSHNSRRNSAKDLLDLERKIGADRARMEDLKRGLREIATDQDENFKEEFAGEGVVKVAGRKDGALKGILPVLDAEQFLGLSERRRETLLDGGLVKMEEQRSGTFYGSVTVEVF
jgi:hypothetical protein